MQNWHEFVASNDKTKSAEEEKKKKVPFSVNNGFHTLHSKQEAPQVASNLFSMGSDTEKKHLLANIFFKSKLFVKRRYIVSH